MTNTSNQMYMAGKLIRTRMRTSNGLLSLILVCRELVQVVMAATAEMALQNFPKQIPFQQAVGHW